MDEKDQDNKIQIIREENEEASKQVSEKVEEKRAKCGCIMF